MTTINQSITCILCPVGCQGIVKLKNRTIVTITGYACPRGEDYVRQEVERPRRTVISVIRCIQGDIPTISVKTSLPVPKEAIRGVMGALCAVRVTAPVAAGDIIIPDVCGLGVDVVATRSVDRV
jgi:CxxC motif-containing protein